MNWWEIVIIVACAVFVCAVIAGSVVGKRKGKSCCGGNCSCCSGCSSAKKHATKIK